MTAQAFIVLPPSPQELNATRKTGYGEELRSKTTPGGGRGFGPSQLIFLAVMVTLAVTKNEVVHTVLTVVAWVLFAIFIGSYGFAAEMG